jgi:hypothetical protein
MSKDQICFDQPIPPDAICAECGRNYFPLKRCFLTGMGDHPRRILFCDDCIQKIIAKSPTAKIQNPASNRVMSEEEMWRETRKLKALDRLGTDHPICVCCGETDWRCMELHHLEGEDFGKTLVIVCRNCHRKLSDVQKDHPQKLGESPMNLEIIGQFLRGLADALILIAEKLVEFSEYLIEQARLQLRKTKPSKP